MAAAAAVTAAETAAAVTEAITPAAAAAAEAGVEVTVAAVAAVAEVTRAAAPADADGSKRGFLIPNSMNPEFGIRDLQSLGANGRQVCGSGTAGKHRNELPLPAA